MKQWRPLIPLNITHIAEILNKILAHFHIHSDAICQIDWEMQIIAQKNVM